MNKEFSIIQQFMDENRQWTNEVFPTATDISCLKHLRKECDETVAAIMDEDHTIDFGKRRATIKEFADMYLLLLNAASRYGLSFIELHHAAVDKMAENRKRKWGKPNAEGFTEHVKDKQAQCNHPDIGTDGGGDYCKKCGKRF